MQHVGVCHCGSVKATFETERSPDDLGVRLCRCDFCRRHGAVNISDPDGETVIDAAEKGVERYRFALKTADFLICRNCGVYIAAVIGEGENKRSTINVAGLRIDAFLNVAETPMEYGAESIEDRLERRFRKWTPTRFSDAGLNASYFGPH